MVDFSLQQMGLEAGGGAVVGGIIGFAAKKIAKVIAVLVGLQLALFKFLEAQEILTVDWEKLTAGMVNATSAASSSQPPSVVMSLLAALPVSAGFTGGFLVGFKRG
ncbi:FUN14 domain-containing protein [Haloarculaceae archaeon H-GB2-1]|nr:FUN14 domain-containing protein [Haloarculaceae archaeon H-GB1-1]MEA5386531.1 FUN14 domain-containing protein [Haloarculaceae archaeon H-GB11]MEA5408043.1 FUN14 domain-containing protein [Haloarculaceae archaeon H-GB2-1]